MHRAGANPTVRQL